MICHNYVDDRRLSELFEEGFEPTKQGDNTIICSSQCYCVHATEVISAVRNSRDRVFLKSVENILQKIVFDNDLSKTVYDTKNGKWLPNIQSKAYFWTNRRFIQQILDAYNS